MQAICLCISLLLLRCDKAAVGSAPASNAEGQGSVYQIEPPVPISGACRFVNTGQTRPVQPTLCTARHFGLELVQHLDVLIG